MIKSVNVLGTGGAFDVTEGNSSFVINMNDKNYLIDCGYDVFPKLIKYNLADKIDYICITHCHDDHIGSLSAYLYYCFYVLKKKVKILTSGNIESDLMDILNIMGMRYLREYDLINRSKYIRIIDTTNLHSEGMPSCGFIFDDQLIISGDIGVNIIEESWRVKDLMENKGAILFHDATTFDSPVHCSYLKFKDSPYFNRIYLYHHAEWQRKLIPDEYQKLTPSLKLGWEFGFN